MLPTGVTLVNFHILLPNLFGYLLLKTLNINIHLWSAFTLYIYLCCRNITNSITNIISCIQYSIAFNLSQRDKTIKNQTFGEKLFIATRKGILFHVPWAAIVGLQAVFNWTTLCNGFIFCSLWYVTCTKISYNCNWVTLHKTHPLHVSRHVHRRFRRKIGRQVKLINQIVSKLVFRLS